MHNIKQKDIIDPVMEKGSIMSDTSITLTNASGEMREVGRIMDRKDFDQWTGGQPYHAQMGIYTYLAVKRGRTVEFFQKAKRI